MAKFDIGEIFKIIDKVITQVFDYTTTAYDKGYLLYLLLGLVLLILLVIFKT